MVTDVPREPSQEKARRNLLNGSIGCTSTSERRLTSKLVPVAAHVFPWFGSQIRFPPRNGRSLLIMVLWSLTFNGSARTPCRSDLKKIGEVHFAIAVDVFRTIGTVPHFEISWTKSGKPTVPSLLISAGQAVGAGSRV